MQRLTFDEWKKAVNKWLFLFTGLTLDDLPDVCYADWYDHGTSAVAAAKRALRYAQAEGY
jgi:hypothetical protein